MELGLSLGETPITTMAFSVLDKSTVTQKKMKKKEHEELGFCMALGRSSSVDRQEQILKKVPESQVHDDDDDDDDGDCDGDDDDEDDDDDDEDYHLIKRPSSSRKRPYHSSSSSDLDINISTDHVPLQLDLLPSAPVPRGHSSSSSKFRFPWITDAYGPVVKGVDVNRQPGGAAATTVVVVTGEEAAEEAVTMSSPNSTLSSFHMDFCVGSNRNIINNNIHLRNNGNNNMMIELESERASSRASDDEENGSTRKKLRLSKEQSAFLEESFKEHSTLNPKQKQALAKQLNLRPRQVEVWFQNRRARTKLKQTEVDCEYLKRCCETLTEENRRLQKELQELRALKTSQPYYMQLPATTLTMCPSCERVATTGGGGGSANSPVAKPNRVHPFSA